MRLNNILYSVLFVAFSHAAPANPSIAARSDIEGEYVAKLTSGMAQPLFDQTITQVRNALGAAHSVGHTYNFHDFRGFSFDATPELVQVIERIPGVEYVHPDSDDHSMAQSNEGTREDPTGYALDQISHRQSMAAGGRTSPVYRYIEPLGQYQNIYVVDSGIRATHEDFEGRVEFGSNVAPRNVLPGNPPNSAADICGHGTPVAAAAAGSRYGVASRANIIDVRIFNDNCSTRYSSEVAGIDYAYNSAQRQNEVAHSVINYSAGGVDKGRGQVVKDAFQSALDGGMFIAVAAGNDRIEAQYFTPANVDDACTVGGTDSSYREYYNTNYGNQVDIFAPGANLYLPSATGDQDYKDISGTSFASPIVAGMAAAYKSYSTGFDSYSPVALCRYFTQVGTKGAITFTSIPNNDFPGPNIILFNESN